MFRNLIAAALATTIIAGLSGCAGSPFAGPGTQARATEEGLELSFGPTFFNYKTSELDALGEREVERIAALLHQKPQRPVVIEGHTDDIGSDNYNQALSAKRADAVKSALIAHGIERERLTIAPMGETLPVAFDSTRQGRAKNRRVEVIIR